MKKLITSLALYIYCALSSYAITPLWSVMHVYHRMDQKLFLLIAGDIYKVPAQGGTAVQLTTQTFL